MVFRSNRGCDFFIAEELTLAVLMLFRLSADL
jgi:hypothetical protein